VGRIFLVILEVLGQGKFDGVGERFKPWDSCEVGADKAPVELN
jgi:hypothetical protein